MSMPPSSLLLLSYFWVRSVVFDRTQALGSSSCLNGVDHARWRRLQASYKNPMSGPRLDQGAKQAKVIECLRLAGSDGLTKEEIYMKVRHDLSRTQVGTAVAKLRTAKRIEYVTKASGTQLTRYRLP